MKSEIAKFLVSLACLVFVQAALADNDKSYLVKDENHVVYAQASGQNVVIVVEFIGILTDIRNGTYPNLVAASILVDKNNNSQIDEKIDACYSFFENQVCVQRPLTPSSTTVCGAFKTKATATSGFAGTEHESKSHPYWQFVIPKKELSDNGKMASIAVRLFEVGKWIALPSGGESFGASLSLDFAALPQVKKVGAVAKHFDSIPSAPQDTNLDESASAVVDMDTVGTSRSFSFKAKK